MARERRTNDARVRRRATRAESDAQSEADALHAPRAAEVDAPHASGADEVHAPQSIGSEQLEEALASAWWVYVLLGRDARRTYVGSTIDLERRLRQHNGHDPGGAAATRGHRPWSLARTYGPFADRSAAQRVEASVKRLGGARRLAWRDRS